MYWGGIHIAANLRRHNPVLLCVMLHIQCGLQAMLCCSNPQPQDELSSLQQRSLQAAPTGASDHTTCLALSLCETLCSHWNILYECSCFLVRWLYTARITKNAGLPSSEEMWDLVTICIPLLILSKQLFYQAIYFWAFTVEIQKEPCTAFLSLTPSMLFCIEQAHLLVLLLTYFFISKL